MCIMNEKRISKSKENKALAEEYFLTRDKDIRNKLVINNLKLVYKIAQKYSRKNPSLAQDLYSEGKLGLIVGIDRYMPAKGWALSTYVIPWIKAYILNFALKNQSLMRVSLSNKQKNLWLNLSKERERLKSQGVEVTTESLAEALVVDTKSIEDFQALGRVVRLDAPLNNEDLEEGSTMLDQVSGDGPDPDEAFTLAENEVVLQKEFLLFKQNLNKSEKIVFEKRLLGNKTLQEIGDELSVSKEWARKLEIHLTNKLARFAIAKSLQKLL